MYAFLMATGLVALAEMGDKTQLLALLLAARFRRPLPIISAIAVATLANHALAGLGGLWLTRLLDPLWLRWLLGLSFLAMAAWTLIPDKLDDEASPTASHGVFLTTLIAFFLAEMGDKTQLATVALAARFQDMLSVVTGTTAGMLLANAPAVVLGHRFAHRLPLRLIHALVALLFVVLGIATLAGAGARFGV